MHRTKRIALWSGPRNISTTLMYSFAQRKDTQVFDEPLYGYYLKNSDAQTYHPSAKEILENMETNGEKVIEMMLKNEDAEVLFYKNMTHHLLNHSLDFLNALDHHILLTRHPKYVIASFAKVIENPSLLDIGFEAQAKFVDELLEREIEPLVIDSKQVLLDPASSMKKLCNQVQLDFDPAMLYWEKGPKKEDGIWAKHWYENVHQSTGFIPYKEKSIELPNRLLPLYKKALPLYERLMEYSVL